MASLLSAAAAEPAPMEDRDELLAQEAALKQALKDVRAKLRKPYPHPDLDKPLPKSQGVTMEDMGYTAPEDDAAERVAFEHQQESEALALQERMGRITASLKHAFFDKQWKQKAVVLLCANDVDIYRFHDQDHMFALKDAKDPTHFLRLEDHDTNPGRKKEYDDDGVDITPEYTILREQYVDTTDDLNFQAGTNPSFERFTFSFIREVFFTTDDMNKTSSDTPNLKEIIEFTGDVPFHRLKLTCAKFYVAFHNKEFRLEEARLRKVGPQSFPFARTTLTPHGASAQSSKWQLVKENNYPEQKKDYIDLNMNFILSPAVFGWCYRRGDLPLSVTEYQVVYVHDDSDSDDEN